MEESTKFNPQLLDRKFASEFYFKKRLAKGREWETKVSIWFRENEKYVFDVYEYEGIGGEKTPKLKAFSSDDSLILPDLQIASDGATMWVEVKSKESAIPPRGDRNFRITGVDLKYVSHYEKVKQITGLPVLIAFVHIEEKEVRIASLQEAIPSRSKTKLDKDKVFWNYDAMKVVAIIDDTGKIVSVSHPGKS